jgi:hypothetical protein
LLSPKRFRSFLLAVMLRLCSLVAILVALSGQTSADDNVAEVNVRLPISNKNISPDGYRRS